MSRKAIRTVAQRPTKMTAYHRALVEKMARELIILDGSMYQYPHIWGVEAMNRLIPGRGNAMVKKRQDAMDVVLSGLKFNVRDWQFAAFAFYKDKGTGVQQYSMEIFDPQRTNSGGFDVHYSKKLQEFIDDSKNTSYVGYGTIAVPTLEIDIDDDEFVESILQVFEANKAYDRDHTAKMRLARQLEKDDWAKTA